MNRERIQPENFGTMKKKSTRKKCTSIDVTYEERIHVKSYTILQILHFGFYILRLFHICTSSKSTDRPIHETNIWPLRYSRLRFELQCFGEFFICFGSFRWIKYAAKKTEKEACCLIANRSKSMFQMRSIKPICRKNFRWSFHRKATKSVQ